MAAALAVAIAVLAIAAAAFIVTRDGGSSSAAGAVGAIVTRSATDAPTYYIVRSAEDAAFLEAFGVAEFGVVLVEEDGGAALLESIAVANLLLVGEGLPEYKIVDLR